MEGEGHSASWLRESPPFENMIWWLEIPAVTYCRALIAEGIDESLGEAEKRLLTLLQLNEDNHNSLQMMGIMTLLALCLRKQDRMDDALAILRRVCDLAKLGEWMRPLVEAGPEMAELLHQLGRHPAEQEFIHRVLAALESRDAAAPTGTCLTERAISPPTIGRRGLEDLTQREFDVLKLLAQRLQNKEIGEQLFISSHTVNDHLKHIYAKLGVNGRRQAVTRAVELGILQLS
jgi:LuxR family maltose regulon positive regulatory protein